MIEPATSDLCQVCGKEIAPLPIADALCTKCRYHGHTKSRPSITSEFETALNTAAASPESAATDDDAVTELRRVQQLAVTWMILSIFGQPPIDLSRRSRDKALTRLMVFAWRHGITEKMTARDLAQAIGISEQRVSQIRADLSCFDAELAQNAMI